MEITVRGLWTLMSAGGSTTGTRWSRAGRIGPARATKTMMRIAGHVSRAMLSRYSHVRMEAKRPALAGIAARQRPADEKRKEEAERPVVVCNETAVQMQALKQPFGVSRNTYSVFRAHSRHPAPATDSSALRRR